MASFNLPGDKLTCENCGRDTFAIRRENGLEIKYRDRWILILDDVVGTILFRCRSCKNTSVYHVNGGITTDVTTD